MNDREHDLMEVELQRLKPAKPPQELMDRLLAAVPAPVTKPQRPERESGSGDWLRLWLRWLVPVSAVGLVVFVSVYQFPWAIQSEALKADDVQINHKLVSSFDAVAELPDGKPVRFRVREWSDETVLHDSARGLVVESSTPRLEVIPVGFDTY